MNDRPDGRQPETAVGVCASCRHALTVVNDRGSRFVRCERSRTDPAYARYPRLPLAACQGHEPKAG